MSAKITLASTQLSKTFSDGGHEIQVLKQVSFSVRENETAAIFGASGSGKSTLLHLLGGLDSPTSGQVMWENQLIQDLSEKKKCQLRNRYLGFVYQFHHLLPEFSALENVAIPLLLGSESPKSALEKAANLLDQVGLSERKTHRTGQLSGGERQRVAMARALVTNPRCVLADEPTGNLDEKTARQVMEVMLRLREEVNTSFVVVTHNLAFAEYFESRYTLAGGVLEKQGK